MKYLVQLRPPQFVFLVALSLAAIPGLAIQSEAGNITITFDDSTDTISVSTTDTTNRVHAVSCPDPAASFEGCNVIITRPSAGATISSADFPFQQPGTNTVVIGDPGGSTVSDLLGYGQCSQPNCGTGSPSPPALGVAYSLHFNSDPSTEAPFGSLGDSCSAVTGGCQIIETGTEQPVGKVLWSDQTVDAINFISNTEVPEPASILLFLPGFAAMCAARRFHPFVRPAQA